MDNQEVRDIFTQEKFEKKKKHADVGRYVYISQAKDEEHSLGKKTLQRKSCEEIRNFELNHYKRSMGEYLVHHKTF